MCRSHKIIIKLYNYNNMKSLYYIIYNTKQTLFKNVFLTRSVLPDGKTPDVPGMGGSPSFCSRLSATTRKARRPILIRSGVSINLIGRPTLNKS